jgi:hypothetical protein
VIPQKSQHAIDRHLLALAADHLARLATFTYLQQLSVIVNKVVQVKLEYAAHVRIPPELSLFLGRWTASSEGVFQFFCYGPIVVRQKDGRFRSTARHFFAQQTGEQSVIGGGREHESIFGLKLCSQVPRKTQVRVLIYANRDHRWSRATELGQLRVQDIGHVYERIVDG